MCYSVPVDRVVRVLQLVSPLKAAKCCMCLGCMCSVCLPALSSAVDGRQLIWFGFPFPFITFTVLCRLFYYI